MRSERSHDDIRRRAEEVAHDDSVGNEDAENKLVYELKVHQIELEMQNSELRASQQQLELSRRQYEVLFEYAPVAYFVFSEQGGIIEANYAAAALLKADRRYLDHKPFVVFLANEYHEPFFSHLRRVFEIGTKQSVEIQLATRQGDSLWARMESRLQRGNDGEAQCLTAVVDISQRKLIEDDLIIARDDALSANREKSVFLANLSHEIRTPMNGILAMSELALQGAEHGEQRRYVSAIHSSARSLLALLDDVLDLTRVEADTLSIVKEPFKIRELLTSIESMFQPNAEEKGLSLGVSYSDSLSEVLVGDRNRLRQILINLVSNAITYTESGSVTIYVREDEISDFIREISFEVADTGPGIAPAEQRRIYETFNRALEDADWRYDGTGLGLAISRRLASLLGGQLYFETAADRGTRFFFTAPLEVAGEDDSPAAWGPTSPETAACGRVLVAEDNAINLLVLRTLLDKAGYEVVSVNNGGDAIRRLEQERFDVVLMDISMPAMDGLQATHKIRHHEPSPDFDPEIPVIAISAHSMKGDRERFLAAGMNDYISKPFQRSTVLDTVARHVKKSDKDAG